MLCHAALLASTKTEHASITLENLMVSSLLEIAVEALGNNIGAVSSLQGVPEEIALELFKVGLV